MEVVALQVLGDATAGLLPDELIDAVIIYVWEGLDG